MKGIGKIGKVGRLRLKPPKRSRRDIGTLPERNRRSPVLADAMRLMKTEDERFAKTILSLKEKHPYGSFPELIALNWLTINNEDFVYQAEVNGGRQLRGGQVPDFVIQTGGKGLVWRIQGQYWHSKLGASDVDIAGKVRMLGQYINGLRVDVVVDLWEDDVYTKNPKIFEWAMAGIGLRG